MSIYLRFVAVVMARSARTSAFLVTRVDGDVVLGTWGRSCSAKRSKPMKSAMISCHASLSASCLRIGPGPHGQASTGCRVGSVGLLHVAWSPLCWHVGFVGCCVCWSARRSLQAMRKCSFVKGNICSTGVISHAPAPGPPAEFMTVRWVVVIWSFV